jgi:hypothetical protein
MKEKFLDLTFSKLRELNLSFDLIQVTVRKDEVVGLISNPTKDLRANRPWAIAITDSVPMEYFLALVPGVYKVRCGY